MINGKLASERRKPGWRNIQLRLPALLSTYVFTSGMVTSATLGLSSSLEQAEMESRECDG